MCHMYNIVSKTYDVVTSKRYDVVPLRHRMSRTRCRIIKDDDVVNSAHDVISKYFLCIWHRVFGYDVVSSDTMSCSRYTMSWWYDVATSRRRVFCLRHSTVFFADIIYDVDFFIRRRDLCLVNKNSKTGVLTSRATWTALTGRYEQVAFSGTLHMVSDCQSPIKKPLFCECSVDIPSGFWPSC